MRNILLIISGSIAAYKSLDLIRRLRERDCDVRVILTRGGAEFITPLSVASLSGNPVYGDLFSLKDETEMGHIKLTREAEIILVAPASADLIAKMANGFADDLATAALLAADKQIFVAPAMNEKMWGHPATQRNLKQIEKDGVVIIPPSKGSLACGEVGAGRLAEVEDIIKALFKLPQKTEPEISFTALVTSGPTHEPLDPVRYIGNRSSGKQGHAIAQALAEAGGEVTLVTGPTSRPDPDRVKVVHVTSAAEMLAACDNALPVDVAVCAAAVADWRVEAAAVQKLKKRAGAQAALTLVENPDILQHLGTHPKKRPGLVIGFAAETENLLKNAADKRKNKGADWIVANDVSGGKTFGSDENEVVLVMAKDTEHWPLMSKEEVAERLVEKIIAVISEKAKKG